MPEVIGEAFVAIRPDTKGFGRETEREVDRSLGSMGATVGKFAAGTAVALGVAGTAVAAFGLNATASAEQTAISFQGILGSAEKASAFMKELQAFAATTPFEFPELANAAKNLLAVGYTTEDVIPIMTKLGNVAAVLGVGGAEIEGVVRALNQMKGKGKASAEELQQISEQIPGFSAIQVIADSLGITVPEAFDKMKDGALDADTAIAAILEGMEKFPGAAGAMAAQSKTLNGVLSTLKDTARQALIDGLAPILPGLTASITEASPIISETLGSIAGTFGKLFDTAAPVLSQLLPIITKLADIVGDVLGTAFDAIAPIMPVLGVLFAEIAETLGKVLTPIIKALAPILGTIVRVFTQLFLKLQESGIFEKLASVIEKVLVAIEPVIAQIGDAFLDALTELMPSLLPLIDAFVELVVALLPLLPLWVKLNTLLIEFLPIITPVIAIIAETLTWALHAAADAVNWLRDNWRPAWEWIQNAAQSAWDNFIGPVFNKIAEAIGIVVFAVNTYLKPIWDGVFDGLVRAWNEVGKPALDVVIDVINTIIDGLNSIPLLGFNIPRIGGGGQDHSGQMQYPSPIGPGLDGQYQYPRPIGPGLNGYANGGIVPGRMGQAQLAVVHGGEEVLTPEQRRSGPSFNVKITTDTIANPARWTREMVRAAREESIVAGW